MEKVIEYISHPNVIIVGIAGCSRCGKTMLTKELLNQYKTLKNRNNDFTDICASIHLDRYFNMEKIDKNVIKTKEGNKYGNWEFPGALDWDEFFSDIKLKIKELTKKIKKSSYIRNSKGILFIEGFLLFSPVLSDPDKTKYLNIFDYYIYICLNKKIARERRMNTTAVYDDYYDDILWPEHIKYCSKYVDFLKAQKKNKKNILIIDGNQQYKPKFVAISVLKWIDTFKSNDISYNEIYNQLFVPINKQITLLENNFK